MRKLFLKPTRRGSLERDLEAELAFHREMAAAGGNPVPLGNAASIMEQSRDLCASLSSRICGASLHAANWFERA